MILILGMTSSHPHLIAHLRFTMCLLLRIVPVRFEVGKESFAGTDALAVLIRISVNVFWVRSVVQSTSPVH